MAGNGCPHCLLELAMNGGFNSPTTAPNSAAHEDAPYPPIEKLVAEFPGLEIQHLIGHGGMGAVYQARQINLDRVVALKILSPRLGRDPAFAERFLREAQTLAKLAHPNIVTVFDFGRAGEFYYLTMEFVDGINLRDTISTHVLTPGEALAIVPQVCEALQYAHDKGVIHRDIKPENILIAKNGAVKIADFGLAKMLQPNPDQFTLTGTRQVLGTMNYMAPEQIETPDIVDHRADLYSLGVVFYELLTGELPLGRFSLPSEKSASVSNRLDEVVMRSLEKDPNRRFQQASQIKTACQSLEMPTQDDAPQVENVANNRPLPLCQPFPITINDVYAGLAAGYGLMRGFETHLELEFEIRDSVVEHRWSSANVQVPLENVTSVRLQRGWMSHRVDVQCDRMDVVSQIPGSKQGSFRVQVKKRDLGTAEHLVYRVNEILGCGSKPARLSPMPPVKASNFASRDATSLNTHRIVQSAVAFLFVSICLAAGLAIILTSILVTAKYRSRSNQEPATTATIEVTSRPNNSEVTSTVQTASTAKSASVSTTEINATDEKAVERAEAKPGNGIQQLRGQSDVEKKPTDGRQ
jgi:hypothetical protein